MAEYESMTIKELVEKIDSERYVLPAMQRNFVWPEDKIYHLFDSLMRDYPIGTFLFWEISKEMFSEYVFNAFIRDVDEQKGKMQRGERATDKWSDYISVLDGQQRITSLYVGVMGKYRTHIKGKKWDDDKSFYDRYMCMDALSLPEEDESYSFSFQAEDSINTPIRTETDEVHYWIKIATVFDESFDAADFVENLENDTKEFLPEDTFSLANRKSYRKNLTKLQDVLTKTKTLNYYTAKGKNLPEVVDIFVRVNSGGQKLSASDLMLSIASGAQGDVDIHLKMQEAIDYINNSVKDLDTGFKIDKELVLTAGLMFTGAETLSLQKKENYSSERMNEIFLSKWDTIIDALAVTVGYIEHIGFCGNKLTSKNLILPIAYYFYKNNLGDKHKDSTTSRARCDRILIRQWLLRAMINSIFLEGTGATLKRLRTVIDHTTKKYFPLDDMMAQRSKRTLIIDDDTVTDLMDLKYGDGIVQPLLMAISTMGPEKYEVDHIWPKAKLLRKKEIKKLYPSADDETIAYYQENCHRITNLELLRPVVNNEKSDRLFDEWFHTTGLDDSFLESHFIPKNISYDFSNFKEFNQKRENLLLQRIRYYIPKSFEALVEHNGLKDVI